MKQEPLNNNSERECNIYLAEEQAYIIDALITSFDETVTFWIADCGYDEYTVRTHHWFEIGLAERQLHAAPLVNFAKKVAWTHI